MRRLIVLVVLAALHVPTAAHADWRRLKSYLKPEATIVRESDTELVIAAPGLSRHLVLRDGRDARCDFYKRTVFRRGGNPYQVWYATPALVGDAAVSRRQWGTVFMTAFLRILRVPKTVSQ